MKNIYIILMILLFSCETNTKEPIDFRTECEKALDYIQECVGYKPHLASCTISLAEKILSTSCENIEELWR